MVISEEIDHSLHLPTFSPEGSKIAAMVADEFIGVWETCSGRILTKSPALKDGMRIHSLVFSPDGNRLLIQGRDRSGPPISLRMWHINEEDNCVIEFDHDHSAAFFPNASQIITISSEHSELRIWDIMESTPRLLLSSTCLGWPRYQNILWPDISSDGTRLLACGGLWDINNFCFRELVSFDTSTAKFSPDSKLVVCGSYDNVRIFDAITGTMLSQSHCFVHSPSFSLDSKQLCSINQDQNGILVTRCSSTSVEQDILSHVYRPDSLMMSQQSSFFDYGGWYRGVNAASIIWLPVNMRKVQLATGTPWFGSRYLILGRTVNDLTILDMEDYLCRLSVKGVWREGGIRYVDVDGDEERRASALASSSGLSVRRSQMAPFAVDADIDFIS
jgi:WD40 repeat protein